MAEVCNDRGCCWQLAEELVRTFPLPLKLDCLYGERDKSVDGSDADTRVAEVTRSSIVRILSVVYPPNSFGDIESVDVTGESTDSAATVAGMSGFSMTVSGVCMDLGLNSGAFAADALRRVLVTIEDGIKIGRAHV